MLPQPMSWSEPLEGESNPLAQPDLADALQRQIDAGFPPGLALDLVLNELVVRAATATRASSAALALKRGDEMVCRAATGENAPDLGIPLNTRDGLSGACLRSHQSQLCLDTETDPRVDAATSRRLGVRSMLIVPVLEGRDMVGVLEVFATTPAEFVDSDQNLLEIFAREVARIRLAALELEQRPTPASPGPHAVALSSEYGLHRKGAPYEMWSLILGGLAILLAVAISFLIGARIGWLGESSPRASQPLAPAADRQTLTATAVSPVKQPASAVAAKPLQQSNPDGLVIYDQGKVVFRVNPSAPKKSEPSSTTSTAGSGEIARVWLAPETAERRLRERVEPQYPAEAQAAHRTGDVVLEVIVGTTGSISSARPVSGDPLLAAAAADAVRTWKYEPYRVQGRPAEFQTDVTLKFSLPE